MSGKIKISELRKFDIADYLDSDEAIAEYLTEVLAEKDWPAFGDALGDAVRARGLTEFVLPPILGRESFDGVQQKGPEPTFDTIRCACEALGLRLAIIVDDERPTGEASGS